MPNILAIIHHNAREYLSNPLLHEIVIAATIQKDTALNHCQLKHRNIKTHSSNPPAQPKYLSHRMN